VQTTPLRVTTLENGLFPPFSGEDILVPCWQDALASSDRSQATLWTTWTVSKKRDKAVRNPNGRAAIMMFCRNRVGSPIQ
jgi:hypothetical protein